ncbi:MAG: isoamylase early set domain-containing protein [Candidatus Latescibacterota bacterium]
MIRKTYSRAGRSCRVTFTLSAEVDAQTVYLCGEFNDWDESAHPMKRRKDGSFSETVSLKSGHSYRFRYLLDGARWENDPAADGYVSNAFGSENSVVEVRYPEISQ